MVCSCRWRGPSHHCVSCHFQFRDISDFDLHRKRGKCLSVVDMASAGVYSAYQTQDGLVIYHRTKGS